MESGESFWIHGANSQWKARLTFLNNVFRIPKANVLANAKHVFELDADF